MVIALMGHPNVGKDYFVRLFNFHMKKLGKEEFRHLKFASELRRSFQNEEGKYFPEENSITKTLLRKEFKDFCTKKRKENGDEFYTNKTILSISGDTILSDLRFYHEVKNLRNTFQDVKVVKIHRIGNNDIEEGVDIDLIASDYSCILSNDFSNIENVVLTLIKIIYE